MAELTSFVTTTSSTYNYGLGLARETTLGRTYWGHGGSIWGYKSKMICDTTCMGAVVCGLANSFPAGMDGLTFLLYRVLLNNLPGCSNGLSGATTVCQGQNTITYSVPSVAHATSYLWTLPSGATGTSNTNSITVNYGLSAVSGTIRVKGVNAYGSGGEMSLAVTVNPKPASPVITQIGNTLHSSAASGNQWYNQSGIINGAVNQDYIVTADGDYHVKVTLSGCTSENSDTISILLTSIDQVSENHIIIYPNPSPEGRGVEIAGSADENAAIDVFDITGKLVLTTFLTAHEKRSIRINGKGMYVVRTMFSDGSFNVQKVLIY